MSDNDGPNSAAARASLPHSVPGPSLPPQDSAAYASWSEPDALSVDDQQLLTRRGRSRRSASPAPDLVRLLTDLPGSRDGSFWTNPASLAGLVRSGDFVRVAAMLSQVPAQVPNLVALEVLAARQALIAHQEACMLDDFRQFPLSYSGPLEYVAEELAFALGMGRATASSRIAAGTFLIEHLPATFAALRAGRITLGKARTILDVAKDADPSTLPEYEKLVLPDAGEITVPLLREQAAYAIMVLDPEGANKRHRRALRRREVTVSAHPDGMATLTLFTAAQDVEEIFAAVTALAAPSSPDDTRSLGQRRVDAMIEIFRAILDNGEYVYRKPERRRRSRAATVETADVRGRTPESGGAGPDQPGPDDYPPESDPAEPHGAGADDGDETEGASPTGVADEADPAPDDETESAPHAEVADEGDQVLDDEDQTAPAARTEVEADLEGNRHCDIDLSTGGKPETDTGLHGEPRPGPDASEVEKDNRAGVRPRGNLWEGSPRPETSPAADPTGSSGALTVPCATCGQLSSPESARNRTRSERTTRPGSSPAAPCPTCGRRLLPDADPNRVPGRSGPPSPGSTRRADPLPLNQGTRPRINVTISQSTLLGADNLPAYLAGHGPICALQARAIAIGGDLYRMVTDPLSGTLLDLGRTTYQPNIALREYVCQRDRTCQIPGCRQPAYRTELDHEIEFRPGETTGGDTSADNLRSLCKRHHHLRHSAGWQVTTDRNTRATEVRTPLGRRYRNRPPTPLPTMKLTDTWIGKGGEWHAQAFAAQLQAASDSAGREWDAKHQELVDEYLASPPEVWSEADRTWIPLGVDSDAA